MKLSDFDFDLPEELIALRPARPRDAARLLVVRPRADAPHEPELEDRIFRDLPDYLRPGDVLVFNDTKVIPARLSGRRVRQGADSMPRITMNLHRQEDAQTWRAFARPAKKLQPGDRVMFGMSGMGCSVDELWGEIVEKGEGGEVVVRFSCPGQELAAALSRVGEMPLPPYIASRRRPDPADNIDYQTVFAEREAI